MQAGALSWLKVKKNRLKFYKKIYKLWPTLNHFKDLDLIRRALGDSGFPVEELYRDGTAVKLKEKVIIQVRNKYWLRALAYITLKHGKLPRATKTKAMLTLLERGFVHCSDAKSIYNLPEVKAYCHISSTEGGLVWDEAFNDEQEAYAKQQQIGVPGYTFITKPYSGKKN